MSALVCSSIHPSACAAIVAGWRDSKIYSCWFLRMIIACWRVDVLKAGPLIIGDKCGRQQQKLKEGPPCGSPLESGLERWKSAEQEVRRARTATKATPSLRA